MDIQVKEKKDNDLVASWFKNHVVMEHVSLSVGKAERQFEMLIWGEPGTSIYQIKYSRLDNVLTVSGDVFEAVYSWSEVRDLRWISGLDLSYFASKCRASENGRGHKDWNRDKAREWLEDYLQPQEGMSDDEFSKLAGKRLKFIEYDGWGELHSNASWIIWLARNGYDVFGDDYTDMENIGSEISLHCRAHLVGLRMAFERMDQAEKGVGNGQNKN
jgi:hypothetical protein